MEDFKKNILQNLKKNGRLLKNISLEFGEEWKTSKKYFTKFEEVFHPKETLKKFLNDNFKKNSGEF